jgi:hypothetical protein
MALLRATLAKRTIAGYDSTALVVFLTRNHLIVCGERPVRWPISHHAKIKSSLPRCHWRREVIVAVVVSLLQALLLWGAFSLAGGAGGRIFPVAGIILMLSYELTHLSDDAFEETYAMDNSVIVAIAATQFAILFLAEMLLTIHSGAH